MAKTRSDRMGNIISTLNGISVGELSGLTVRLDAAQGELQELKEAELAGSLGDAKASMLRGDVANFRRLVSQVVSRLGHLRA